MFGLFNVVWYDGHSAYVSKYILDNNDGKITPHATGKLENYISGDGEILKVEFRNVIDLDDIIEMNESTATSDRLTIDRFKQMYFKEV